MSFNIYFYILNEIGPSRFTSRVTVHSTYYIHASERTRLRLEDNMAPSFLQKRLLMQAGKDDELRNGDNEAEGEADGESELNEALKDSSKETTPHPLLIDTVLTKLTQYIRISDLKSCRVVCQKWNHALLPRFKKTFAAEISVQMNHELNRISFN